MMPDSEQDDTIYLKAELNIQDGIERKVGLFSCCHTLYCYQCVFCLTSV